MLYLQPVSTIILVLCPLIYTVVELSTLFIESTGSLSSLELSSSQLAGVDFKLQTFMDGSFFFFLAGLCGGSEDWQFSALNGTPVANDQLFCRRCSWT